MQNGILLYPGLILEGIPLVPVRALASIIGALIVAAVPLTVAAEPTRTAPRAGYASVVHRVEASDLGLTRPTGLSYSAATRELIVLDGNGSSSVSFVATNDAVTGAATLATVPGDAINLAYDATRGRLAEVTSTADLVSIPGAGRPRSGTLGLSHRDIRALGLRSAAGLATDASGALYILDAVGNRIVRLAADAAGQPDPAKSSVIGLGALAGARARGLAIQQATGHLFVLASSSKTLYELDATGALVTTRDLRAAAIRNPQGLVIAPSSDNTDAASAPSLYVADAGIATPTGSTGAGIAEIALAAPLTQTALLAAPTTGGTVVGTIITKNPPNGGWTPDSPDPSDLAFNSDTGGGLILTDGEVEETTGAGFHNVNGWQFSPTGTVDSTFSFNTTLSPYSNKEPAGVAYKPGVVAQRRLFVSNDGKAYVQEVSADTQGRFYRTGGLVRQWSTLATGSALQSQDSEGLGYGVVSGTPTLFIADGKDKEIWTVKPGNNGIFEGRGDDVITHFDTLSIGQNNPEDVAFDSRDNTLWIISNKTNTSILHTTLTGTPIETINVASNPFVAPGGIAVAPASSGGGSNLYVADRGIDNNPQPTENDGKIYEIAVAGGGGNTPPTADPVSANTTQNNAVTVILRGSDAETCDLTFTIVNPPSNGTLSNQADQACVNGTTPKTDSASVLYTPNLDYSGPDSFTYKVNDGTTDSASATVTITVTSTGGGGIALRAAASGTNTGATTLVLPLPTGTTANDVLLAAVTVRGAPIITAPAGWTPVRNDARAPTFTQAVYVHVAGGSEPANYTFTFDSSQTAVGTIVAYSGVDNTTPIAAHNAQVTSSSSTITAKSVTTAVPNTQLVAFFGIVGKTTIGTSSGMTERAEVFSPTGTTSKLTASLDDQPMAAAGATGDRTATAGVSAHNIGQLVALKPA